MNRTRSIIASCLSATALLPLASHAQTPEGFLQGRIYELRRNTTPPSCFEWAQGLPNGVWGDVGDYAAKSAKLIDAGGTLVASALYKPTGERVSYFFYQSRTSCEAALAKGPETPATPSPQQSQAQRSSYVQRLQRDFGARLHYSSPMAEAMVRKINIDCKAADGRYLPLYNALLARLHEASEADAWMETRVVDSGNNIRVYDTVHLADGKQLAPQLTVEISTEGGVKAHSVRSGALSDACFGAYGPIWTF